MAAGVALLVAAAFAWRAWRRISATRAAASALLDVHQARLDATLVTAGSRVARLAEHGDELNASIAELRAGSAHLGWLLGRVPDAQANLGRELLHLLLPTDSARAKAAEDD